MRVTLAAIDHNMHLSRKSKLTNAGKEQGHRKYSKRSQKLNYFHAEIVKKEKSFSYFPFLIAKMLHRHSTFEGSFTLPSDRMNEFDAKQISPTIGMKEPPSTETRVSFRKEGKMRIDTMSHHATSFYCRNCF